MNPDTHIRTRFIINEFCGEHHMGAAHNEFIPSESILGVKRFFTTNCRVLFPMQTVNLSISSIH